MGYVIALLAAVATLAAFEWRTDEDIITLAALIASSFALGAFRPRLFWLSGMSLGLVIPALALLTLIAGIRPIYETTTQAAAHGASYVLGLVVLVLPAILFAWLGSLIGKRVRMPNT